MRFKLFYLLSFIICNSLFAQEKEPKTQLTLESDGILKSDSINLRAEKFVNDYTFDKLVFQDLNFLILGDNSPSQGLSYTFKEDGSEFSLSGKLFDCKNSFFTAEAKFNATNGIYYFDDDDISKSASMTINYFRAFSGKRFYNYARVDKDIQRTMVKAEIKKLETIRDLLYTFRMTKSLIDKLNIRNLEARSDLAFEKFKENLLTYELMRDNLDTDAAIKTFITKNKLELKKKIENPLVVIREYKDKEKKQDEIIFNNTYATKIILQNPTPSVNTKASGNIKLKQTKNLNHDLEGTLNLSPQISSTEVEIDPLKLIALYDSTVTKMDSIQDKLSKIEMDFAQPYWNAKRLYYFGISPYYEREVFTEYAFKPNTSFSNLFEDQVGDLFGVKLQLAFFYQSRVAKDSIFIKEFIYQETKYPKRKVLKKSNNSRISYIRALLNIGGTSNLPAYRSRTINGPSIVQDTTDQGDLTVSQSNTGYINSKGRSYEIKRLTSLKLEAYHYFTPNFGLFAQYSFVYRDFSKVNDGIDPTTNKLRAGILTSLKNKKKPGGLLTLQLFADYQEPILFSATNDTPWRFGLKVGLPINFKSKL